jgi:hypothetical protein
LGFSDADADAGAGGGSGAAGALLEASSKIAGSDDLGTSKGFDASAFVSTDFVVGNFSIFLVVVDSWLQPTKSNPARIDIEARKAIRTFINRAPFLRFDTAS